MKKKELKRNYKRLSRAYWKLVNEAYQMQYLGAYKGVPFFIPMNTDLNIRNELMRDILGHSEYKFIGTIMGIPTYIPANTSEGAEKRMKDVLVRYYSGGGYGQ